MLPGVKAVGEATELAVRLRREKVSQEFRPRYDTASGSCGAARNAYKCRHGAAATIRVHEPSAARQEGNNASREEPEACRWQYKTRIRGKERPAQIRGNPAHAKVYAGARAIRAMAR